MNSFKHTTKAGLSFILVLLLVTSILTFPAMGFEDDVPNVEDFEASELQNKYSGVINEYTLEGNSPVFKEIRHQIGDGTGYGFTYPGSATLGMLKVASEEDDAIMFEHGYYPGSGMHVEDGKLILNKTTIQSITPNTLTDGTQINKFMHDYYYLILKEPISSGVCSFSFKFSSSRPFSGWSNTFFKLTGTNIVMGWNSTTLTFGAGSGWNTGYLVQGIETNRVYDIEFLIDFDNKVVTAYVDGVKKVSQTFVLSSPWTNIYMTAESAKLNTAKSNPENYTGLDKLTSSYGWQMADGETWTFTFDDIILTKLAVPEAHINIEDDPLTDVNELERVSVDTVPTITLDSAITKADMKRILFYKNGELVEAPEYSLSDDGLIMTIEDELSYSSSYTVEIPQNVPTDKRINLVPATFSFHTEHKATDITVEDVVTSDMGTLTGGSEFTASATFVNNEEGSKTFTFWMGIYKDGVMKDIDIKTVTLAGNGGTATPELTATLPGSADDPSALDGVTFKTFVWDSLGTLVPLVPYKS